MASLQLELVVLQTALQVMVMETDRAAVSHLTAAILTKVVLMQ
jgi:hypothetical protein